MTTDPATGLDSDRVSQVRVALKALIKKPDHKSCIRLKQLLQQFGSIYRHWELAVLIVQAIEKCECTDCADELFKLTADTSVAGMVALTSASAYVRLARSNLSDTAPVEKILNLNRYQSTEGALQALGYDRMTPSPDKQKWVIETCRDFGIERHKGLGDPRYGLVAACANWPKETFVVDFLEHCDRTGDVAVKELVSRIRAGKELKLR